MCFLEEKNALHPLVLLICNKNFKKLVIAVEYILMYRENKLV